MNPAGRIVWEVESSGQINHGPVVSPTGVIYYVNSDSKLIVRNHVGRLLWQQAYDKSIIGLFAANRDEPLMFRLRLLFDDGDLITLDSSGRKLYSMRLDLPPAAKEGPVFLCIADSGMLVGRERRMRSYNEDGAPISTYIFDSPLSGLVYTAGSCFILDKKGLLMVYDTFRQRMLDTSWPLVKPAAEPILNEKNSFFVGGSDWVVYSFQLPESLVWSNRGKGLSPQSKKKSQSTKEPPQEDAGEIITAELISQAGRDDLIMVLERTITELRKKNEGLSYERGIKTLELLAGVGVLNPRREGRRLINDYPEIRRRAVDLLGLYGDLHSIDFLTRLARYEWDSRVQTSVIQALGNLRSDPDGNLARELLSLTKKRVFDIEENPALSPVLISSIDRISRYSGVVRSTAAELLKEIYYSGVSRDLRLQAIETLRSFNQRK